MHYVIICSVVFVCVYGPRLWVNYVLNKHHKHMPGMPGTGGELAIHLLDQFRLDEVKVEQTQQGEDYYSPADNKVCLSPEVYTGKSLSAVAVAAHEVGHAIQFNRNEAVSLLRGKYLNKAHAVQHYGVCILMSIPIIGPLFAAAHLAIIAAIVGVVTMFASVMLYVAILPEEWDASFNKALPILEKGAYVPAEYLPAIRQVLKACALTYVAAALSDILNIWRWIAIIK